MDIVGLIGRLIGITLVIGMLYVFVVSPYITTMG